MIYCEFCEIRQNSLFTKHKLRQMHVLRAEFLKIEHVEEQTTYTFVSRVIKKYDF